MGLEINFTQRKPKIPRTCGYCGKRFEVYPSKIKQGRGNFCSSACGRHTPKKRGANHYHWGGGISTAHGYVTVHSPGHPAANKRGQVYKHRLIMEQNLGRYLLPGEIVHYKDGNKKNNRPENLQLFPSDKEHRRFHRGLKRRGIGLTAISPGLGKPGAGD